MNKYEKIYFKHYKKIVKILNKSKLIDKRFVKSEAAAACLACLEFFMLYSGVNYFTLTLNLNEKILKSVFRKPTDELETYFEERCSFYQSLISNRPIHGFGTLGNFPDKIEENPPMRFSFALTDCLLNTDCIADYDNAAIPLFDMSALPKFLNRVIIPVCNEFRCICIEVMNGKRY